MYFSYIKLFIFSYYIQQVNTNELDPKLAYIQVTHVVPYFCKDELENRLTEFEQNHDVDTFSYDTPFTQSGAARGNVEEQWKRRTILSSEIFFYYFHSYTLQQVLYIIFFCS